MVAKLALALAAFGFIMAVCFVAAFWYFNQKDEREHERQMKREERQHEEHMELFEDEEL